MKSGWLGSVVGLAKSRMAGPSYTFHFHSPIQSIDQELKVKRNDEVGFENTLSCNKMS